MLGAAGGGYSIDPVACEGCELCRRVCPADAIHMEPVVNGAWMVSETRFGPLVHARLGVAEDNSGKLVTLVRNEARRVAEERGLPLVIVDGSPGIGCPVIASLAGADLVLAVTEPTRLRTPRPRPRPAGGAPASGCRSPSASTRPT